MSHQILKSDRFGYVGQPAWHGIGVEIPAGTTAEEGFRQIGLDWPTVLVPVEAVLPDGTRVAVPDRRAHLRADTRKVLGFVGPDYKSMENVDLAKFADAVGGADGGTLIETAGSLFGSKVVYALIKMPERICAVADDCMDLYLLCVNGHGGSRKFASYPTGVRVVCANTLRFSEKDAARGIAFQHTGDFDEKVKAARTMLGTAREEMAEFRKKVDSLVRTNLSAARTREFMEAAYDECFGKVDRLVVEADSADRLTEKRAATVEAWMANLDDERQRISGIRGTAWAAFNAVTQWIDHDSRPRTEKSSEARVASNLLGPAHDQKLSVLRLALATARG
ncbi:MAG: DUF932 domain-containing protein [Planctomycetes bacterium]|nr:DUF932 domain-containing protein [Planctomycetota bacterium]